MSEPLQSPLGVIVNSGIQSRQKTLVTHCFSLNQTSDTQAHTRTRQPIMHSCKIETVWDAFWVTYGHVQMSFYLLWMNTLWACCSGCWESGTFVFKKYVFCCLFFQLFIRESHQHRLIFKWLRRLHSIFFLLCFAFVCFVFFTPDFGKKGCIIPLLYLALSLKKCVLPYHWPNSQNYYSNLW